MSKNLDSISSWAELGGTNSMADNSTINWRQLGDSGNDNMVCNIFVDKANNVYTCGIFPNTVSFPNYVEMYNGRSWVLIGTDSFYQNTANGIWSVCTDSSGNIYASSAFFQGNDTFAVAKFSNGQWNIIGPVNINLYNCNAVCCDSAGNLYAAVCITGSGSYVAKYVGNKWQTLGSSQQFNGEIVTMHIDGNDNVYVGGSFTNAQQEQYVARYSGGEWHELQGLHANGTIRAITTDKKGNIYAGGDFYNANNHAYVAKYNGSVWSELGHFKANNIIFSVCCDDFDNVYAAGMFTDSNGLPYVAYYNTNAGVWSSLGSINNIQTNDQIRSIVVDHPSRYIYAGGSFSNSEGNCYVAVYEIVQPV